MRLMWTGSDTLFATRLIGGRKFPTKWSKYPYFLGMTFFVKAVDFLGMIEGHYVVSEHLKHDLQPLKLRKPIKVLVDPPQDFKEVKRVPHSGFNVLYYRGVNGDNQVFKDWVYGYDVFMELKRYFADTQVSFIEVNGKEDLSKIYPIVDLYVRPSRHDGCPRMIMECEQIGIPYYWSKENLILDDMIECVEVGVFNKTERTYFEI